MSKLVQYIIVNSELKRCLHWSSEQIITQCCNASTAVIETHNSDRVTKEYVTDIDQMCKVVLQVANETELWHLSEKLSKHQIKYKIWIEPRLKLATCIAVKPYKRDDIDKHLGRLPLLK